MLIWRDLCQSWDLLKLSWTITGFAESFFAIKSEFKAWSQTRLLGAGSSLDWAHQRT